MASARSLKYIPEQENLEDPPYLKKSSSESIGKKNSGLFSSLRWSKYKKKNTEQNYDEALYSFHKSKTNPLQNEKEATLSSSNLESLNNRLKSFKSSRTLSYNRDGSSLDDYESRNKIRHTFTNHFTYSKEDIQQLLKGNISIGQHASVDDKILAMEEGGGNQNPMIQSLKSALKTMTSEIDSLEEECQRIEDRYIEASIHASQELQQSMNVLFQFQQKCQKLVETKEQLQMVKDDLKAVKSRLISKEKERRSFKTQCDEKDALIKRQTTEITELNKILGESSEDIAKMKMDAKYANSLMDELSDYKEENRALKNEVLSLKAMQQRQNNDEDDSSDVIKHESVVVGLGDSPYPDTQPLDNKSFKVIELERDELQAKVSSQEKLISAKDAELSLMQENLNNAKDKLSALLSSRIGDNSRDEELKIHMEELSSERQRRAKLESQLEEEKERRLATEEKFEKADAEWKALIAEVDQEMKSSQQAFESLQISKTALARELEKCRSENSNNAAMVSPQAMRDVENRLVQALADTRKAHVIIQELRGAPSFSIKVFVKIGDPVQSESPSLAVVNQDHVSLQLKDTHDENCLSKKFVFDKVFNEETHNKLLDSLDEYVDYAVNGKQTSIVTHGDVENKNKIMFGTASGDYRDSCVVQVACKRLLRQLKTLQARDGWIYDVKIHFVRILDEDILDIFGDSGEGETSKVHEIKRTSDGSTTVTNVDCIEIDITNDDEVQSLISHALGCRYKVLDKSISIDEWKEDCAQSHFVFTVELKGTQRSSGNAVIGKLSFVELAGEIIDSDKPSKSKRSLQCVGDIINSISKRQGHIPYRNSKITYVLQPSFSNNGKSLMIFGLSNNQSYAETLKILQFATKAFHCAMIPGINMPSGAGNPVAVAGLKSHGGSMRNMLKDGKNRTKSKASLSSVSSKKL